MLTSTTINLSYADLDGRKWIVPAPTSVRQYPRDPVQAVAHALAYLDSPSRGPHSWSGRGMTAVARCYGLRSAQTDRIPRSIPGSRYSAVRQYRWLANTHPDLAVPAPNPFTFGDDVPAGAILYWDESTPEGGGAAIAAGYRGGILQTLAATENSWELRDTVAYGCVGWTVPVFYAGSSSQPWELWDGDNRTDPAAYDSALVYDSLYDYDADTIDREGIW